MCKEEADNLHPEYEHFKQSLLKEDRAHYGGTSWSVAKEEQGKYAWVVESTKNHSTVLSLGLSRGKGNVDNIGKVSIDISDYGAYINTLKDHQLCFAHPHRKLSDLAESNKLSNEARECCTNTFYSFASLYKQISSHTDSIPSVYLKQKRQKIFDSISETHIRDLVPQNKAKYFTLIHLVLKGKIPFGSKKTV
jgi:hypothetical protein